MLRDFLVLFEEQMANLLHITAVHAADPEADHHLPMHPEESEETLQPGKARWDVFAGHEPGQPVALRRNDRIRVFSYVHVIEWGRCNGQGAFLCRQDLSR